MAVTVPCALEPPTPNSLPGDHAQNRNDIDWRVQVVEAEIPLFDALRDWRAERARRDGVAPDMICTNQQLVAMVKACPQRMSKLGTIDGIGESRLERHGQEIPAVLAWPRGASPPSATTRDSGSVAPAKSATPDHALAPSRL